MGGGMMGYGMRGVDGAPRHVAHDICSDGWRWRWDHLLTEFQAAHERIFKAMDSNKDGRLTQEEMQAYMHGTRRSIPQQ